MVFSELVFNAGRAIFNKPELLRQLNLADLVDSIRAEPGFPKHQRVPPEFMAAVLPYIKDKLRGLGNHLLTVSDVWQLQNGPDLFDVMAWGTMEPADCVIAIAAASQAEVLIADDHHFAHSRTLMKDRLGLELIDLG
jgi:hypothetical protein